jgi:hypothetical protein
MGTHTGARHPGEHRHHDQWGSCDHPGAEN